MKFYYVIFLLISFSINTYDIMSYNEYAKITHENPYIFTVTKNGQYLYYFGANHSCSPENEQYVVLKNFWSDFLQKTTGKNCVVLVEGSLRGEPENEYDAITKFGGEGGLITFYAQQNNIPVICPEPAEDAIQKQLETAFTGDEINYRSFAHTVQQYNRYKKINPKLVFEEYYLSKGGKKNHLDAMKLVHKRLFGADICVDDGYFFYAITNPVTGSTVINMVCRMASKLRDQLIVKTIDNVLSEGKHIFIAYGATHAVMQERAILDL